MTKKERNFDRHTCIVGKNCSILVEFSALMDDDLNFFSIKDKCAYNDTTLYPLNHLLTRRDHPEIQEKLVKENQKLDVVGVENPATGVLRNNYMGALFESS